MSFVNTKDGWINLAHVAKIKTTYTRDGQEKHLLYSVDGSLCGTTDDPDFDILVLAAPVVHAAPGSTITAIHSPHYDAANRPKSDDVWSEKVPVLAWRCTSAGVVPVTPDDADLRYCRILHPLPNGHFFAPGDQTFESVEQAVSNTLRDAQEGWDRPHAMLGAAVGCDHRGKQDWAGQLRIDASRLRAAAVDR